MCDSNKFLDDLIHLVWIWNGNTNDSSSSHNEEEERVTAEVAAVAVSQWLWIQSQWHRWPSICRTWDLANSSNGYNGCEWTEMDFSPFLVPSFLLSSLLSFILFFFLSMYLFCKTRFLPWDIHPENSGYRSNILLIHLNAMRLYPTTTVRIHCPSMENTGTQKA